MAQFRTNHQRNNTAAGGSFLKVGLFVAVLGVLFLLFKKISPGELTMDTSSVPATEEASPAEEGTIPLEMLPISSTGVVIIHEYFALSYSEEHEQAEWVAYELTRNRLNNIIAKRADNYRPDPKVESGSAELADYRRSGFDRGHLVPAGDMGFSSRSMSQTFYLSNMSPQLRHFNGGIWRELEENVRDWARRFRHLYIVSGPILTDRLTQRIGPNQVSVPKRFFKVILDLSEPELKGIGFIVPNEVSTRSIDHYAVSIDEVEAQTGLDFFPELLDDALEERLESQSDPQLWSYDQNRFKLRLKNWNRR